MAGSWVLPKSWCSGIRDIEAAMQSLPWKDSVQGRLGLWGLGELREALSSPKGLTMRNQCDVVKHLGATGSPAGPR